MHGRSKTGYLHGSVSGPETPDITVRPPRRPGGHGQLRAQKSFVPSIGRQRGKGDSERRAWDGTYEPQVRNHTEPRWVPSGAPPNAPGHEGRSSPQRERAGSGNAASLRMSDGWTDRQNFEETEDRTDLAAPMTMAHHESLEDRYDTVRTSYASAPSEPPAAQNPTPIAQTLASDAAAMLEAARGARPRDEGQDLENLDEEFYSRLSKLREDHQRNLNEISQLYESSVEASYEPQPQQSASDEPQPHPELAMPAMMSEAEAQGPPEDNRPWWQRDDKDYGEVLRRLKALDIPLPPGAGGPAQSHEQQDAERDKRALYSWSADGAAGGAGESPWGDRQKARRPASAPRARRKSAGAADKDGWVARSTIVQPFKFDSRPKRATIMAERTSYDLEVKRRLEEAECSTRFRAEPIPPETTLPLYEKQEREKEAVRAKRVADRFQYLQETSDPPSCYYQKPTPQPTVEKPPPFKAKPVPPSTKRSLMQSFIVDDTMRKERVEARAQQLLREARLPSRQEAHQREVAEKQKQMLSDPRAAELEDARRRMRERKIGVERFSYKPKITKKVPDYHTKQREFADKLKMRKQELKAQVEATAAKPFNIHESEPNLDRVHHDIMRDESLLPENRWPYMNSRLKGHSEPPPKKSAPKKMVCIPRFVPSTHHPHSADTCRCTA